MRRCSTPGAAAGGPLLARAQGGAGGAGAGAHAGRARRRCCRRRSRCACWRTCSPPRAHRPCRTSRRATPIFSWRSTTAPERGGAGAAPETREGVAAARRPLGAGGPRSGGGVAAAGGTAAGRATPHAGPAPPTEGGATGSAGRRRRWRRRACWPSTAPFPSRRHLASCAAWRSNCLSARTIRRNCSGPGRCSSRRSARCPKSRSAPPAHGRARGDLGWRAGWLLPVWERMAALPQSFGRRAAHQAGARAGGRIRSVDADWLARIEQAQRNNPRDANLQYLAGMACMKRQLWGKAQQLLTQAGLGLNDDRIAPPRLAGLGAAGRGARRRPRGLRGVEACGTGAECMMFRRYRFHS